MISKEIKKEGFAAYGCFLEVMKQIHVKGDYLDVSLPEVLGAFRAKPEWEIGGDIISLYANIFYGGVFYGKLRVYTNEIPESCLSHYNYEGGSWEIGDTIWHLSDKDMGMLKWNEGYIDKEKYHSNDDVFMSVNTRLYDFEYPKEFNASDLDYKASFWNEVYHITGGYDFDSFVNDVKEYANSQGLSDVFKYFDLVTYKWKTWSLVNKILDDENQINLSKVKMPQDIKDKANQVMQYIRDCAYDVYYMAYEYALECEQENTYEEDYEEEVI